MQPTYFDIPQPCSENWNEMTPTQQGAFCSKCTKEVLDCTTLKPSEIKQTLAEVKSPCIRITTEKIDELNFLEWFNHLTLRKQLKYLFLFAFLFVFNLNGTAQQEDTTLIQPQHVEIDSADDLTTEQVLEELEAIPISIENGNTTETRRYWIPNGELEISIGCIIYGDVWYIDPNHILPPAFDPRNPYLPIKENKDIEISASNYLLVGDQRYTFFIEEDTLIFNSNADYDENISIKVIHKYNQNTVYFAPILIPQGQRQVRFPLTNFPNGFYQIIVEGEKEAKGIELMYW